MSVPHPSTTGPTRLKGLYRPSSGTSSPYWPALTRRLSAFLYWPALTRDHAEHDALLRRPTRNLRLSRHQPFDSASHPLAPCGTLVVLLNSVRETWDNFGLVGFYLGPSLQNYRSYRCLVQETMKIRISDSIILYPAPLVVPGASRFDQLITLTSQLHDIADTNNHDTAS
jgi:hypothetical protein